MRKNKPNARPKSIVVMVVFALLVLLSACEKSKDKSSAIASQLQVWAHAGQAAERDALTRITDTYNQRQTTKVVINYIPERTYNAQVQAAAAANDLPCLLELDGPYLYNYIWQNQIMPLDNLLSESIVQDLLPSIVAQGQYLGKLYGVGIFDSGLGLFALRSELNKLGIRIPDGPADAWELEEFSDILSTLAKHDKDGAVIDLKFNYPGEWFTYAFSPVIQSAGGDLINRKNYQSSQGYLNGSSAITALSTLRTWIQQGYVDPNVDDAAFIKSRVALSWAGHWEYARYADVFDKDLVLLPLPDFGYGTKTGQGSWLWSISRDCQQTERAKAFLEYLLSPQQVLDMANANGAVPGNKSAIAQSELYKAEAPLHLFVRQLMYGYAVPRPKTPAYPVITGVFQQAFQDIRNGATVKITLDNAVAAIDKDIKQNKGYRFVEAQ